MGIRVGGVDRHSAWNWQAGPFGGLDACPGGCGVGTIQLAGSDAEQCGLEDVHVGPMNTPREGVREVERDVHVACCRPDVALVDHVGGGGAGAGIALVAGVVAQVHLASLAADGGALLVKSLEARRASDQNPLQIRNYV